MSINNNHFAFIFSFFSKLKIFHSFVYIKNGLFQLSIMFKSINQILSHWHIIHVKENVLWASVGRTVRRGYVTERPGVQGLP